MNDYDDIVNAFEPSLCSLNNTNHTACDYMATTLQEYIYKLIRETNPRYITKAHAIIMAARQRNNLK